MDRGELRLAMHLVRGEQRHRRPGRDGVDVEQSVRGRLRRSDGGSSSRQRAAAKTATRSCSRMRSARSTGPGSDCAARPAPARSVPPARRASPRAAPERSRRPAAHRAAGDGAASSAGRLAYDSDRLASTPGSRRCSRCSSSTGCAGRPATSPVAARSGPGQHQRQRQAAGQLDQPVRRRVPPIRRRRRAARGVLGSQRPRARPTASSAGDRSRRRLVTSSQGSVRPRRRGWQGSRQPVELRRAADVVQHQHDPGGAAARSASSCRPCTRRRRGDHLGRHAQLQQQRLAAVRDSTAGRSAKPASWPTSSARSARRARMSSRAAASRARSSRRRPFR